MQASDVIKPFKDPFCVASWSGQNVDNVINSTMESGAVSSRRRFTGLWRKAEISFRLPAKDYKHFTDWFNNNMESGLRATWIREPDTTVKAWRFLAPPSIQWIGAAEVFEVSVEIIRNEKGWPVK